MNLILGQLYNHRFHHFHSKELTSTSKDHIDKIPKETHFHQLTMDTPIGYSFFYPGKFYSLDSSSHSLRRLYLLHLSGPIHPAVHTISLRRLSHLPT
ncbi:hypothetical protein KUTeg_020908 [Tegillarca granosa]|uniref:Uncharacterized protein n=1 Tax=Tegillarca granosa TaxID=220873 RepID=A0ABQ9EBY1_TEGGR|nr:hypothetical protein KUTeg_020908 [Tegillarca granosa]